MTVLAVVVMVVTTAPLPLLTPFTFPLDLTSPFLPGSADRIGKLDELQDVILGDNLVSGRSWIR